MMKHFILITLSCFFTLLIGQNNTQKDYYANGNLKCERILLEKGEIIKEYYKNGQIKYYKNGPKKIIEKYYKNGQLSYVEVISNDTTKTKLYDRDGHLIMQLTNGLIVFSIYENDMIEKHNNHGHDHHHNHNHHH